MTGSLTGDVRRPWLRGKAAGLVGISVKGAGQTDLETLSKIDFIRIKETKQVKVQSFGIDALIPRKAEKS